MMKTRRSLCGPFLPALVYRESKGASISHLESRSSTGWLNFSFCGTRGRRSYTNFIGKTLVDRLPENAVKTRIESIVQETPTVKSFTLTSPETTPSSQTKPLISFLPGQWCDIFLPSSTTTSSMSDPHERDTSSYTLGLSMTSSPLQPNRVQFACKYSKHPIVRYIHHHAKVGDTLYIDGGYGPFYYDERAMGKQIVLIGGGIGVTPLVSVMRYLAEARPKGVSAKLVHSVTTPDELLFHSHLKQISQTSDINTELQYHYTITREAKEKDSQHHDAGYEGRVGRIDKRFLLEDVKINTERDIYYISGPFGLVKFVKTLLTDMGVDESRMMYEKWLFS